MTDRILGSIFGVGEGWGLNDNKYTRIPARLTREGIDPESRERYAGIIIMRARVMYVYVCVGRHKYLITRIQETAKNVTILAR